MRREDIPFAVRLTNGEKWGVTRADLERLIRLNPRGCFVACDGNRRLGLTTTTAYGKKLAWIGNVIVHRNYRGRHVGRALVEQATLHLQETGAEHIALYCYKEQASFYENLGFLRDRPFLRLRRRAAKAERFKKESDLKRPPSMASLLAADMQAFGADRSKLIRAVLADDAGWILGFAHGTSSTSYLMVKESAEECEFGPWICLDPSPDEPSRMMHQALIRVGSLPVEVGCLRGNRPAMRTLKMNGFRAIREGYRMFFQEKAKIGDDNAQYGLGFLDKG
jgi:ribosomal protein S18 acetylase RimI-like enzyme